MKKMAIVLLLAGVLLAVPGRAGAVETMADYTDNPIFMTNVVTPNILILMDSSGSMNDLAYTAAYDATKTYYGYFKSTCTYNYSSGVFSLVLDASNNCVSTGAWSGNFLNWASMRRLDVGRKVVMGGLATSRTGGGNQTNIGDSGSGWFVYKWGSSGIAAGTAPYLGTRYAYVLWNGNLDIWDSTTGTYIDSYTIKVQKNSAVEPEDFVSGNLSGIMQQVETKARWGLEFFNSTGQGTAEGGGASGHDGGYIAEPITGTGYGTNMVTTFQNKAADAWTPLAEALYTATGYFKQDSSMRYNNGDYLVGAGTTKDPMYYSELSQSVTCGKNFVLVITDGAPTMDSNIPVAVRNSDPDVDAAGTAGNSYATDYFDDVAHWAHTTDLRSDLTGTQNLTIYTVFAFGAAADAEPTKSAAKNGAFTDSNSNNLPDLDSEWASLGRQYSGVTVPDTYYEASDPSNLASELMAAITDILKRATSGTAISVLATSGTGAGNIYQAYFLPSKSVIAESGAYDVKWLGHLLSLNIDANGSLRDKNNTCMSFRFDTVSNQTVIDTLNTQASGTCGTTITSTTLLTAFVNYNWDGGETLAAKLPSDRKIFTFLDANKDGVVQGNQLGMVAGASEVVQFDTTNASLLQKYLRTSSAAEATNVINWVRGSSVTGLRTRTTDPASTNQYKLGDIIHSTPTAVAEPVEGYGLLYQDAGYTSFFNTNKARTTMVYIGANDGMLHAFNASTGDEAWAYIPYNLLPHLKWLTDSSYTHVDYVDLKVKVTDVNFGTTASPSWKTVLIGGMRFGGGEISDTTYDVDADGDSPSTKLRKWRSAFFCLDVTDPAQPKVLWEIGHNLASYGLNDNQMGFAMTYPSIVKVGDNFWAVVGTGTKAAYVPDYQGAANTTAATLFVINIKTGVLDKYFSIADTSAYFSDSIAVDTDFSTSNPVTGGSGTSYNTDAVYVGETYYKSTGGGSWEGRMWRLVMDNNINPASWTLGRVFDPQSAQPITAAPAVATDKNKNLWLFFGTGKYYSQADKTTTSQQSFYGVKDPCWLGTTATWSSTCLSSSSSASSVVIANLVNVSSTTVQTTGVISSTAGQTTLTGLESLILASKQGWYLNLTSSPSPAAAERSLNKPTVFGGLVMFTSFIPDSSVCGMGGSSYVYALYYITGTAYTTPAIGSSGTEVLKRTQTASVGMASSIAIHSGTEAGAKAFIQLSTGETKEVDTTPPGPFKSEVISWREL